jgi:hemoglobin
MASVERSEPSLYTRLGGYDAIAAVVDSLLDRLHRDPQLGRYWTSPRSVDTNRRERQLAVDFIAAAAGGPTFYLGRDMKTSHTGMGITRSDYQVLVRHAVATLDGFKVSDREKTEVLAFLSTLEPEIVQQETAASAT